MEIIYIKIGLAIIFTLSVIGKLTGKSKSTFEKAGYSQAVMYAIAIAEIILTVMLFTKYELLAALGLLAIIGGAIFTLFQQKAKPARYVLAIITTILLSVLLYFFIG
ncbi:MAG: DoxX family protein [Saprospiraceae bacterium]|nr:DoxX family protein [Saprospiraceae bacterium]